MRYAYRLASVLVVIALPYGEATYMGIRSWASLQEAHRIYGAGLAMSPIVFILVWILLYVFEDAIFGEDPRKIRIRDETQTKIANNFADRYFGDGDYRQMTPADRDFEAAWMKGI